ncbi:DUF2306 domain-containing protein [Bordetella petrii]|uniref:DUF2306 domain-containing protein n=1 Tax=Bordetella petrii TaxID=94624 RepID=UPI0004AFAC48|nr:DUF2306 domain-containing protein [Bordetella petrii]
MSLEPLTSAAPVIQVHAWAAIAAVALGAIVLLRKKGDAWHRWTGRCWLAVMLVTVLSSFFIHELRTWGAWSPIHILSVVTLFLLVRAYQAIRKRNVTRHAHLMKTAFFNALLLAGFFTFLPGRIMYAVVFGPPASDASMSATLMWTLIIGAVIVVSGWRHAPALIRRLGKPAHAPQRRL